MPSILRILPAALVLAFGTTALLADHESQQPDAMCLRFVDMQVVFEKYDPVLGAMTSLRDQLERKKKEFDAREDALKDQAGELALLDPSTDAYAEKAFNLDKSRNSLERDRQFTFEVLQRKRFDLFSRSYAEVQAAAEKLGAERGYGAILVVPPPVENLPTDLQSRVQALQSRSVLYANPAYDVTSEVLDVLGRA
jgi:Skp family chaperone for outer membrane proteins